MPKGFNRINKPSSSTSTISGGGYIGEDTGIPNKEALSETLFWKDFEQFEYDEFSKNMLLMGCKNIKDLDISKIIYRR